MDLSVGDSKDAMDELGPEPVRTDDFHDSTEEPLSDFLNDLKRSPMPNVGVRGTTKPPSGIALGNTGFQYPDRADGDRMPGSSVSSRGGCDKGLMSTAGRERAGPNAV